MNETIREVETQGIGNAGSVNRDTIKSLVISYGEGHDDTYFRKPRMKETEYLAHAFENAFIGNRIFEKYLPEIYNEMIAYIKALRLFEPRERYREPSGIDPTKDIPAIESSLSNAG